MVCNPAYKTASLVVVILLSNLSLDYGSPINWQPTFHFPPIQAVLDNVMT